MNDKIFEWHKLDLSIIARLQDTHNIYVVAIDKRDKSLEQIRFLYVLLGEIAKEYYGETDKATIESLKYSLYEDFCKDTNTKFFRTKTASVTEMKIFIDWLIKKMSEMGIPIALDLIHEDFKNTFIWANTTKRICCACGSVNSQIHHTKRIGMGKNRNKVDHTKYKVISLCSKCHSIEHQTGTLLKEKGLYGVSLSKYDFDELGVIGEYEDGEQFKGDKK